MFKLEIIMQKIIKLTNDTSYVYIVKFVAF